MNINDFKNIEKCIKYLKDGYTYSTLIKLEEMRDNMQKEMQEEDDYQSKEEFAWNNQDALCGIIANEYLKVTLSEN